MTGSHEVRGSIPLSSTKKIKDLRQLAASPFLLENPVLYKSGTKNQTQKNRSLVRKPAFGAQPILAI
jgi:hypothetical protein